MIPRTRRTLSLAIAFAIVPQPILAQQEIESVAAFARLYGVARWFYPSDASATLDWNRFAVEGVRRVRQARTAPQLETTLEELFTPLGPGIEIGATLPMKPQTGARDRSLIAWHYRGAGVTANIHSPYYAKRINRSFEPVRPSTTSLSVLPSDSIETPIGGATADVDLTPGLKARVPLSLTDQEARMEMSGLPTIRASLTNMASPAGRDDIDVRLADVVVAWNVLRHFYPYWADIGVNWDTRLKTQLEIASRSTSTRAAHHESMQLLVADLNDGHGYASDSLVAPPTSTLPVQFRIVDEQLVVTASVDPRVPVGSVVKSINGALVSDRIARELQHASGSLQWKRARTERAFSECEFNTRSRLLIETPTGVAQDVVLLCNRSPDSVGETRPGRVTELKPGFWYVDLTRVLAEELYPIMPKLATARGIVFDLRGYPTDLGSGILPFLMTDPENANDRWMHVARLSAPFGEVAAWSGLTWNVQPAKPHLAGDRIFLTDGRAISYAESVMGYVRDYKLGTIIGGTTAGANGNVQGFVVPGGFMIQFTGMRVTRHDGTSPYHMRGVSPDIPVEPTLAGIRAGRDELLERALVELGVKR